MKNHVAHIFISLGLLAPAIAHAAEYRLFSAPGKPVANYQKVLEKLKSDDVLIFSNNETYTIEERLNCGSTTCIFSLKGYPDLALRVPTLKNKDQYENVFAFVDSFIEGEAELRAQGVPSVHIHSSRSSEFAVVDRIKSFTRLDHFLANPLLFEERVREKLTADLIDFARSTSGFAWIGDFKADQVHYVEGRGWVLVDWTRKHRLFPRHWGNPFSWMFNNAKSPIAAFRAEKSSTGEWLRSIQDEISREIRGQRLDRSVNWCRNLYRRLTLPKAEAIR